MECPHHQLTFPTDSWNYHTIYWVSWYYVGILEVNYYWVHLIQYRSHPIYPRIGSFVWGTTYNTWRNNSRRSNINRSLLAWRRSNTSRSLIAWRSNRSRSPVAWRRTNNINQILTRGRVNQLWWGPIGSFFSRDKFLTHLNQFWLKGSCTGNYQGKERNIPRFVRRWSL